MLNPIHSDITNAMQNILSVESPEGKRAMTKLVGKSCLENVNTLFDILNGRVETCRYLDLVTKGHGVVWDYDLLFMKREYGKYLLLAN